MSDLHAKLAAIEQRLSGIEDFLKKLVEAITTGDIQEDEDDSPSATLDGEPCRPNRDPRETL